MHTAESIPFSAPDSLLHKLQVVPRTLLECAIPILSYNFLNNSAPLSLSTVLQSLCCPFVSSTVVACGLNRLMTASTSFQSNGCANRSRLSPLTVLSAKHAIWTQHHSAVLRALETERLIWRSIWLLISTPCSAWGGCPGPPTAAP